MSKNIEDFGEYSVKNVKSFYGTDTLGFNANLYRGKTKIAFCVDDGGGGEVMIDWIDRGEQAILERHCESLPKLDTKYKITLTVDPELFVSELVAKFEAERDINKMRKQCETKTLFRESTHRHGQYSIMKCTYNENTGTFIRTKYGNDVEIFNEVLARGEIPSVFQRA